ncbi:hypothetical protein DPX39_100050800 [Trypanosoma brucei equiperdum]|uniref:Transmembrane protein n=1 Tax=Trypanosoma brucei equiperdum TaxID=630700 RepID=A0A3L6KYQ9_9TRYP|nr:hypothetical protein DPX39_100050800 [Trypanosoma brucei equiperdum]
MMNASWRGWVVLSLFVTVVGVCSWGTVKASSVAAVSDRSVFYGKMKGNWSVFWLSGNQPQRTGFVLEVSSEEVLLRREVLQSVLSNAVMSVVSFFSIFTNEADQSVQCVPTEWSLTLPDSLRMKITVDGLRLSNCTDAKLIPLLQERGETKLGGLLREPQPLHIPADDSGCARAPFNLQGYWIEGMKSDRFLIVFLLAGKTSNCSAIFRINRAEGEDSESPVPLVIMLMVFAFLKFGYRFVMKGDSHKQRRSASRAFVPALTDQRRRELLQQKDEIIQKMMLEDGKR